MSVQDVTYYRVVCGRDGCARDSGDLGFTAAFPTPEAALTDWIRQDGTVDPVTGVTLCNWHAHDDEPSCDICATAIPLYPHLDHLHDRGDGKLHAGAAAYCSLCKAPAPTAPSPVEQADGHPDLPPPVAGPGEPELSERAAGALLDFMVDDLQLRGVQ